MTISILEGRIGPARKCRTWFTFAVVLLALMPFAQAQPYSVDWYKIAAGGSTSTGATYQVTSTIGQPEAGSAMSGGQFSVTGGFWSLLAVVQTAGLPNLAIAHSGNSVTVWWPNTVTYTLQTNNNIAAASGWIAYGGTVNTNGVTNSVTISPPRGNLFFRLSK